MHLRLEVEDSVKRVVLQQGESEALQGVAWISPLDVAFYGIERTGGPSKCMFERCFGCNAGASRCRA